LTIMLTEKRCYEVGVMKIIIVVFWLIGCCCVLGASNADQMSNPVPITSNSIGFYIENETSSDFARVVIQSTKDGKKIYHEGFSCRKTSKCRLVITPAAAIKKSITLVFLSEGRRILSAYILARPNMGRDNGVIPNDEYLGKYVFKQIKIKFKDIEKDDVYNKLKETYGHDASYQNSYKDVYDALVFAVKDKITRDDLERGGFINQFDPNKISE